MAEHTFLLNHCEGTQNPIVAILELLDEDIEKIQSGEITTIKINGLGCFIFMGSSEDNANNYGYSALYTDCSLCKFSDSVEAFKSNPNVLNKFESTRSDIASIIQNKIS